MNVKITLYSLVLWLIISIPIYGQLPSKIELAGEWEFTTDSVFRDKIRLPGSMNVNKKGFPVKKDTPWTGNMWNKAWYEKEEYKKYREGEDVKVVFWLQPDFVYVGEATYQKEFEVREDWTEKSIILTLERPHWETTVWIDGKKLGTQNSLGTPHRYEIAGLCKGKHSIRIRVDNRVKTFDPGVDGHAISDNTQSNWNGIIGDISLEARSPIRIENIKLIPDVENKCVKAEVCIVNRIKKSQKGELSFSVEGMGKVAIPVFLTQNVNHFTIDLFAKDIKLWDEFSPNLYEANIAISSDTQKDEKRETFGFRSLKTKDTQILVNQRPVFLRGTLECCIFPRTGYPPTDNASWKRIMTQCKNFGLNHIRFHSWCPPKVAFEVADSLGMYLQVECGFWANGIGDGKALDSYIYAESERVVKEYGNHPSFCLFLYGNEPHGKNNKPFLTDFVKYWKGRESRFLITTGAGWPVIEESDYDNIAAPRIHQWGDKSKSVLNGQTPGSRYDWSNKISKKKPTISHEIGQWCVYPNLKERVKYTGAFKPKNFDIFEDRLRDNGLLHLADKFVMASGRLQLLCYKADIEAALRTPGFGGFQLLDLHDFPGQGTALVGVLDPFWDEKPYVSSAEYSRFCNSVVPLLRTERFVYTAGDVFDGAIEVAQFSASDMKNVSLVWRLRNKYNGNIIKSEKIITDKICTGKLSKIADLNFTFDATLPEAYTLEIELDNKYVNSWDIWCYPNKKIERKEVCITEKLDTRAVEILRKGGKVLLTPTLGNLKNEGKDSVIVGFSSIFWNTLWTNNQPPHTLGILCDPQHRAFKQFPTEYHSNYQWQDLLKNSNAIPLRKLNNIEPIVRIIDDWFTARSLGLVVEMKVAGGRLLLCGSDLLTDMEKRPEAAQLLASLVDYMNSSSFRPKQTVSLEAVLDLFKQDLGK